MSHCLIFTLKFLCDALEKNLPLSFGTFNNFLPPLNSSVYITLKHFYKTVFTHIFDWSSLKNMWPFHNAFEFLLTATCPNFQPLPSLRVQNITNPIWSCILIMIIQYITHYSVSIYKYSTYCNELFNTVFMQCTKSWICITHTDIFALFLLEYPPLVIRQWQRGSRYLEGWWESIQLPS